MMVMIAIMALVILINRQMVVLMMIMIMEILTFIIYNECKCISWH